MRLQVEVLLDDWAAFTRFVYKDSRTNKPRFDSQTSKTIGVLATLAVGVTFVWILLIIPGVIDGPHIPTAALTMAVFAPALLFFLARAQARAAPGPDGPMLGEYEYRLDDDGWRVESAGCQLFVPWNRTLQLGETDDHFFLMIDTCAGYILPKLCFDCDAEQAAFRDFVATRINGGRSD